MTTGGIVDLSEPELADIGSYAAGEWGMGMYTGGRFLPTHDEIAQLAFSFYESRGRQDGRDVEDWLRAEQQLVRHYA